MRWSMRRAEGVLLTGLGLIGNLARLERRLLFVELDALLVFRVVGGVTANPGDGLARVGQALRQLPSEREIVHDYR